MIYPYKIVMCTVIIYRHYCYIEETYRSNREFNGKVLLCQVTLYRYVVSYLMLSTNKI